MEVFDDLWNKQEQYERAPTEGFEMFTMEEWIQHSSTYKIFTGSFHSPLPPELEKDQTSKIVNSTASNSNVLDASSETPSVNTTCSDAPKDPVKTIPQTSFPISTTPSVSTSTPSQPTARRTSPSKVRPEMSTHEENVSLPKKHIPGGVKRKFCMRMSSLTNDEQRDCLNFFTKFRNRKFSELTGVEKAEFQLYQSLQLRVKKEQEEYLRMAHSEWPDNMKHATTLPNNLLKYTKDLWRDRVKRALGLYKHRYKQVRSVPLMKDREKHFTITLERPLLQIGSIPVVRFPDFGDLAIPYRTTSKCDKLRAWSFLNLAEKETAGSLHKVPVSADPNADRLARLHAADVVLSSSGFKTLLDNHPANQEMNPSGFNRTWCLPVIVKEYRAFENGAPVMKKIVYIDKALPNSQMSGTDYVRLYYKYGFLSSTIRRDYSPAKEFDIKGAEFLFHNDDFIKSESKPFEQSQNDSLASVSTSPKLHQQPDLSVILPPKSPQHSSICSSQPMSSVKECTLKEDDNDMDISVEKINSHDDDNSDDGDNHSSDDDDDNKLLIDWEDKSSEKEVICKSKVDRNKAYRSNSKTMSKEMPLSTSESSLQEVPPSNSDKATKGTENSAPMDRPGSTLKSTSALLSEENLEFKIAPSVKVVNGNALPLNVTNVTYNLWSLAPQEQHETGSRQLPSNLCAIRAIVRCRIDACEQVNQRVEPLHLACKPEFQFEYGAEVETLSQLTRQWANLLIRPDTQLARGRVNVMNRELVMVERRSLTDIALEAKEYHRVSLPDSLHTLYSVFTDLLTLPCGEYLLTHKPQDGAFARLHTMTNMEDSVSLNLAAEYKGGPKGLNATVSWPPLDPCIVLPRNEFHHTMPCMFPPTLGQKFKFFGRTKKSNIVIKPQNIPSKPKKKKRKRKKNTKPKKSKETCPEEGGELEASSTEPTTEVV